MPISRYRRQCQRHQCTIRCCNLFPASVNSFPFSFFRLFKFPLHIASSLRARGNACAVTNNCKQHILPIPIFSGDIQFYYITLFVSHKHTHTRVAFCLRMSLYFLRFTRKRKKRVPIKSSHLSGSHLPRCCHTDAQIFFICWKIWINANVCVCENFDYNWCRIRRNRTNKPKKRHRR